MTTRPLLVSLPKGENVKTIKSSFPLACLQLAGWLREHGHNAIILDFSTHRLPGGRQSTAYIADAILRQCYDEMPLFLGINCFATVQFPLLRNIAERVRCELPKMKICIGGMHPTLFARKILLHYPAIDYIALGEGETQMLQLTRKLLAGERSSMEDIQSFAWRDSNGDVHMTPRNSWLRKFDVPPEHYWGDFDFTPYKVNTMRWNNPKGLNFDFATPISTTRSCPFSCSFCSVSGHMGRGLRRRKPNDVLAEIEWLYHNQGLRYFEFIDDNINVNKEHALMIFRGILERGLDIHFSLTNGIHLASADEELVDVMAEAGLAMIKFPIEHGNDYIRNTIIGKNLSQKKIISLAKQIKCYDIFTFGLFIIGFPEETEETLNDTLRLMDYIELDMNISAMLIPFPGTKIFKQCKKDKLFLENIQIDNLHSGELILDSSAETVYIKPYKLSVEKLLLYKNKMQERYFFSEKAKRLKEI